MQRMLLWPDRLEIQSELKIYEVGKWSSYAKIIDKVLIKFIIPSELFREKCSTFAKGFLMGTGGWKSYIKEVGLVSPGLNALVMH